MHRTPEIILRRVRYVLVLFIIALVISGVTAFPLQLELETLANIRGLKQMTAAQTSNGFDHWLLVVRDGLRESYATYPWLGYGTDWLAFAHIVIAIFFLGPLRDPVRNVWILKAGLIACALIVPLALICGQVRGIPMGWRWIDCSFGIIGAIPLYYCLRLTRRLAAHATPSIPQ
jgi:hypothetical protein